MSKTRGSARTPKKNRPTPRRADVVRRDGFHFCDDTDDLWTVGVALAWLLNNPERLSEVNAIRDAALTAIFGGDNATGEDGDYSIAVTVFARLALCSEWIADGRTRDAYLVTSGGSVDWDDLAVICDVPSAVQAWRSGRAQEIADHSHREAQRALRLVRTPADIPPEVTP